jgi:hypothetical protein
MAADRLTIDPATVFDNVDNRRVEFAADIGDQRRAFAAQYDLLEALGAEVPDDRAVAVFRTHVDTISAIGAKALARNEDEELVVISENDLD